MRDDEATAWGPGHPGDRAPSPDHRGIEDDGALTPEDLGDLEGFFAGLHALGSMSAPEPSPLLAAMLGMPKTLRPRRRFTRFAAAAVVAAMLLVIAGLAHRELPDPAARLVSTVVNQLTPFHIDPPDQRAPSRQAPTRATPTTPVPSPRPHPTPVTTLPAPSDSSEPGDGSDDPGQSSAGADAGSESSEGSDDGGRGRATSTSAPSHSAGGSDDERSAPGGSGSDD